MIWLGNKYQSLYSKLSKSAEGYDLSSVLDISARQHSFSIEDQPRDYATLFSRILLDPSQRLSVRFWSKNITVI